MYEVEMKFRVPNPLSFEESLRTLGCEFRETVEEIDQFYQHPQRDFVLTDECLRIRRRLSNGTEEKFLTYKGPKIDRKTKTRRELEVRIDSEGMWEDILEALGFRRKATIHKFRRRCEWRVLDHRVEVCLDSLPDLKDGNFVELEILASESDLEEKRKLIINLSEQLGLAESMSIQTSYLGLLTQAGQVKYTEAG